MPIKVVEGSMNVLDAAITRVRNVFKNDCKIYLSFPPAKTVCAWQASSMT